MAGVGLWLNAKEDILGVYEERTVNPDGSVTRQPISGTFAAFGVGYVLLVVFWGMVKIWGTYRRELIKAVPCRPCCPQKCTERRLSH